MRSEIFPSLAVAPKEKALGRVDEGSKWQRASRGSPASHHGPAWRARHPQIWGCCFSPAHAAGAADKEKNPRSRGCRGFLVLLVLHRTEYWWSRRESNPRPQALHREFYILSSVI
ncbi:hypothetical protein CBM2610_A70294 [Cupriavidus taiwanensis]|nr:hypothetical protein CBM2610_A70294 [Cupriavidus taiwanensis]